MKRVLPLFSYLFHPIFIPLYTAAVFFYTDDNYLHASDKLLVMFQIVIMTVLIPIAFFFLLKTLGRIDSVMASDVAHRKIPLALQVILLSVLIFQSVTPSRIPELFFFFCAAILTSVAALVAAFAELKPSLHMAAIGAMLVFIIGTSIHNHENMIAIIALIFVVTGLVASSRLEMNAHSNHELFFGFLIGVIPQFAFWSYWL
ncbi:MAG: hypothetical protein EOO48_06675 [Flavobacterium sp.]|nr:MAG: hypothetical protein EOO48_06675 [Flavobacterium sp.]